MTVAVLPVLAAGPGMKAQIVGGTVAGFPAKSSVHVDLTGADALILQTSEKALRINYEKVNTIEYGQNVSRRYAAAIIVSPVLLLSKSRKHYLTLGFVDAEGKQQAVVIRMDKGDIRPALAALEARTGRRVEYTDNEARKGGR
jgi:hypothetical protein